MNKIYALCDPTTGMIRYVGKSINPEVRLGGHLKDKQRTYKTNWIQSLLKKGLVPELIILEENLSETDWQFWEQWYIDLFKSWGLPLTNTAKGGIGFSDPTGIIREKISKKLTGRKISKEITAKAIASRQKTFLKTGKWAKDGTYEKAKQTRIKNDSYAHTEETKEQMSVSALLAFKEGRRKVQGGAGISRPGKLNAVSRGIMQYDLQGVFVKEWESAKQAGESLNVTNSGIIGCCKGRGRSLTFKSFIWRYKSPKENELPNTKESVEETIFKVKNSKELVKLNMREQQKVRWNV